MYVRIIYTHLRHVSIIIILYCIIIKISLICLQTKYIPFIHSSRDVFMTSYIHVVFSVCLQLVEDVKAVDGHQPLRRLRKKVHHRLLLRPNQPGRLSRSEARYKHGIVCDFIILFSWNDHDVFTKFSIVFPVLYVFRLFFWLLSTWVTKKTFTIFAKNKGEWKKKKFIQF